VILDEDGGLPSFPVSGYADYLHFEYTLMRAPKDSGINTMIEFEDRHGEKDDVPWARCQRQSGELIENLNEHSRAINRTRTMICNFNC